MVVVGPTAVGKSDYAVVLAKNIGGEIISADSRQVYKGLDVGSGKVTEKEMGDVPHHMLDVASPKRSFSAHQYKKMATPILLDILGRGKIPIIVGGTGFYIDVLLGETIFPEVPPNKKLRKELEKLSLDELNKKLKKIDPARAKTVDTKNKVRLVRAIEIATALGSVPVLKKVKLPYNISWVGLTTDRETMRKKIIKRTRSQLMQGMVAEVAHLHEGGVSWKRLEELGLEQRLCSMYLRKQLTYPELEKQLTDKIYQYAMRQMTWFKRNKKIGWINVK